MRATHSSARAAVRLYTVTWWPARARCPAIGKPITPRPTKATRSLIAARSLATDRARQLAQSSTISACDASIQPCSPLGRTIRSQPLALVAHQHLAAGVQLESHHAVASGFPPARRSRAAPPPPPASAPAGAAPATRPPPPAGAPVTTAAQASASLRRHNRSASSDHNNALSTTTDGPQLGSRQRVVPGEQRPPHRRRLGRRHRVASTLARIGEVGGDVLVARRAGGGAAIGRDGASQLALSQVGVAQIVVEQRVIAPGVEQTSVSGDRGGEIAGGIGLVRPRQDLRRSPAPHSDRRRAVGTTFKL